MISQNDYYGGGAKLTITADLYIGRYSPRFHALETSTASLDVFLPNRAEFDGRFLVVLNESTSTENLTVKERDGTTVQVLTPGQAYKFFYAHNVVTADAWSKRQLLLTNDVVPARSSITSPSDPAGTDVVLTYADLYGTCTELSSVPGGDGVPSHDNDPALPPACVPVNNPTLAVWDDGGLDDDIIDVHVNGTLVLDNKVLPDSTNKHTFGITLNRGFNVITITGVSVGTGSFCTVALELSDVCEGSPDSGSLDLSLGQTYDWLVYANI